MKVAFSMPGRFGDILWSLPSVRAIAETYDTPVHMVISPKYGSLAALIRVQPYIADVTVDPAWEVLETAPMSPRIPPTPIEADVVVHGAYDGWPQFPLPRTIQEIVRHQLKDPYFAAMPAVDLGRPWIRTPDYKLPPHAVTCGFSDEWFELKVGVVHLLDRSIDIVTAPNSRWANEAAQTDFAYVDPCDWMEAACTIESADCFLGCCSALHVLAVGLGKPCVIMEPSQMRWQDVFWPLGKHGPQVHLVHGGDDLPTFDSRHVADKLREVLAQCSLRS